MTTNFSSCSMLECDQPSGRVAGGCDSCTRHVCLTYKCAEVGETNLLCFPSHKPKEVGGGATRRWTNRSRTTPLTYRGLSPRTVVSALRPRKLEYANFLPG